MSAAPPDRTKFIACVTRTLNLPLGRVNFQTYWGQYNVKHEDLVLLLRRLEALFDVTLVEDDLARNRNVGQLYNLVKRKQRERRQQAR